MRKPLLLVAFALGAALADAPAQVIDRYTGTVTIDTARRGYAAALAIDFEAFPENDTVKLFVHGDAEVRSVHVGGEAIGYAITDEVFYGDQKALVVPVAGIPGERLEVDYALAFDSIEQRYAYDPDWFEFNIYVTWFPWNVAYGLFDHRIEVRTDDPVLAADVTEVPGGYVVEGPTRSFDIPFTVSRAAKAYGTPGSPIQLYAHDIPDTTMARIGERASAHFARFDGAFGAPASEALTILVSSTGRQLSYARPQYISMDIADTFSRTNDKTLAHEVAHLWWNKASLSTWEDWLNEAFAEYCSLVVYRDTHGEEALEERLAKIDAWIAKSEPPPLWGLDKSHESSNQVYTYVGANHLVALEREIGEAGMMALMREVHQEEVVTTAGLLDLVGEMRGEGVRDRLEERLGGSE